MKFFILVIITTVSCASVTGTTVHSRVRINKVGSSQIIGQAIREDIESAVDHAADDIDRDSGIFVVAKKQRLTGYSDFNAHIEFYNNRVIVLEERAIEALLDDGFSNVNSEASLDSAIYQEKRKDMLGCDDVTCIASLMPDIEYIVTIDETDVKRRGYEFKPSLVTNSLPDMPSSESLSKGMCGISTSLIAVGGIIALSSAMQDDSQIEFNNKTNLSLTLMIASMLGMGAFC